MSDRQFSEKDLEPDEVPFAFGSLIGIRSFKVNDFGWLRGVIHQVVWGPGENDAQCAILGELKARVPPYYVRSQLIDHFIASKNCRCGFYAYYNDAQFYGDGQVIGIIEGYGRVTYGSEGFRCSKAKIVALVDPKLQRTPQLTERTTKGWLSYLRDRIAVRHSPLFWASLALLSIVFTLVNLGIVLTLEFTGVYGHGWGTVQIWTGNFLAWSTNVISNICAGRTRKWVRGAESLPLWMGLNDFQRRKVLENYPGIPIYPTVREAIEEHPLSKYPEEKEP